MEDYLKCELMGGGSPRHLNTFSNMFIIDVHYTHGNTCYVVLLLLTVHVYTSSYYLLLHHFSHL